MHALINRLAEATGADRSLDCKIWLTLYDKQIMVDGGGYAPNARPPKYESARKIWTDDWPHWGNRAQVDHGVALELNCPNYTGSIDAAIELVPDGWEWMASNRAPKPKAGRAYIHNKELISVGPTGRNPKYQGHEVTAATPAIAMCIVGLMARDALTRAERTT